MENWRKYLDPEDMTPEERLERVIELLATAVARMIRGEGKEETKPPTLISPSQPEIANAPSAKGRVPFGQEMGKMGRVFNQAELVWIKRIQELAAQGWSSEKIAKQLNKEDHESNRAGRWSRTAVWRILKKLKQKGVAE
ncbi:MAG: recombinase family protein [Elusimicrobia bacterium]|nr:recombinase family protein [Elusimicrobiota bacterium]